MELNSNQLTKKLQQYKQYRGKTQKEIKEQIGNTSDLRDELKRLKTAKRSYKSPKKSSNEPMIKDVNDVMYEILLRSDYDTVKNYCQSHKTNLCNNDFWKNKCLYDYPFLNNYSIDNYKQEYKLLQKLYKDADNIVIISDMEKNIQYTEIEINPGIIVIHFLVSIDYKLPFLINYIPELNSTYGNLIAMIVNIKPINNKYQLSYDFDNKDYSDEHNIEIILSKQTIINILQEALYYNYKNPKTIFITDEYEDLYLPETQKFDYNRWDKYVIEKHFRRLGMLDILNK